MCPASLHKPAIGSQLTAGRFASRCGDAQWLAEQRRSPQARFMVLADLRLAVASNPDRTETFIRWHSAEELAALDLQEADAALLGLDQTGAVYFCVSLTSSEAAASPQAMESLKPLADLRSLAVQGAMSLEELSLAAQARALAAWHAGNRCCGRCGARLEMKAGGWRLECWACGQVYFPRSDPAVIMLVSDGEHCLLGHELRFPEKFYSVLAGFVEPGDDIEHAVRREVMEETGILVGKVEYVASQPWPFPHSLMIGCAAEALTTSLRIDAAELGDARWVGRAEALEMLENRHPEGLTVPGPFSIAHTLIRAFADDLIG